MLTVNGMLHGSGGGGWGKRERKHFLRLLEYETTVRMDRDPGLGRTRQSRCARRRVEVRSVSFTAYKSSI